MSAKINVSISSQKLAELIQAGHLCAADLNCLDPESKQQVWQLCLWSCNKRINCTKACTKQCNKGYCDSANSVAAVEHHDQGEHCSGTRLQGSALITLDAD